MTIQLRQAARQQAKIRLGLFGPSGSGKTFTALLIASGMAPWQKICLIDTENGSGDLYSNLGPYNVITLEAPFHPQKYADAIDACEKAGMEVIIVDSITHEWNGKGGCLEIHDECTRRMKIPNSYTAWNEVTPLHQAFIDRILQSCCHVITTGRTKTEYVLTEKNGKQVPQKVGMKIESRDGFEYELTIALDLNIHHEAFASKDRTGLFKDGSFIPSETTGILIDAWCSSGNAVAPIATPAPTPVTKPITPEPAPAPQPAAAPVAAPQVEPPTDDIMAALDNAVKENPAAIAPTPAPEPAPAQTPATDPNFEPPTGQQIAIIKSLLGNPLFTDEERTKYEKALEGADKTKCANFTSRISAEIVRRKQGGNAAAA